MTTMPQWSDAELADELRDMREHVPYLMTAVQIAEATLQAQIERSTSEYGPDVNPWPASTTATITGLRDVLASARDEADGAREYLRELEAEAARRNT